MFLEHKISLLELFLKDHVTLRTGLITAENATSKELHFKIMKQKKYFKLYIYSITLFTVLIK